jgi:hypothetical protein
VGCLIEKSFTANKSLQRMAAAELHLLSIHTINNIDLRFFL